VVVSTDSPQVAEIARAYGAEVPALRPAEIATSTSPDIEWVRHMLGVLSAAGRQFALFSILRPTSPFRGGETIRRALEHFVALGDRADSLRAVERCRQHPGKMWVIQGELMRPLLPQPEGLPYHSRQFAALPEVYVQDSSLEIAWTRVAGGDDGSIAGARVVPWVSEGAEGFSIDYPDDWELAERLIVSGEAVLPTVRARAA
jgi:N-acylneuraminate cytidylyltransferase